MVYYVYCPRFDPTSYGIRVLYTLAAEINRAGRAAKCLCYEKRRPEETVPAEYAKDTIYLDEPGKPEIQKDDIAIYSEVCSGNPLEARHVVRYLMNKPGVLTGVPIQYGATDRIIAYSSLISDWLPRLYLLNDDRKALESHFSSETEEKEDLVVFYFGKIQKRHRVQDYPMIRRIRKDFARNEVFTRHYPAMKDRFFSTLARASLVVSLDPLTNLHYEAALLGTPVLILNDLFGTEGTEFSDGMIYRYSRTRSGIQRRKCFDEYCSRLESQPKKVVDFLRETEDHFQTMARSRAAMDENVRTHERQRQDDAAAQGKKKVKALFKNCAYPNDIPFLYRLALEGRSFGGARDFRQLFMSIVRELSWEARCAIVRRLKGMPRLYALFHSRFGAN